MPYAVAVAAEVKIPIRGIDYWKSDYKALRDFDDREDHMATLILEAVKSRPVSLILTGYSHVPGLSRRLLANGFALDTSFTRQEKIQTLSKKETDLIPRSFFESVTKIINRVSSHNSGYSEEWAEKRRQLLTYLQPKAGT
jgi:hypothetical protein